MELHVFVYLFIYAIGVERDVELKKSRVSDPICSVFVYNLIYQVVYSCQAILLKLWRAQGSRRPQERAACSLSVLIAGYIDSTFGHPNVAGRRLQANGACVATHVCYAGI